MRAGARAARLRCRDGAPGDGRDDRAARLGGLQQSERGGLAIRPRGRHVRAAPDYQGPVGYYEFQKTVRKEGEHGAGFAYTTVNTDMLRWIACRVTGESLGKLLSERLWHPLGAEDDGYWLVDPVGTAFAGEHST